MTTDTVAQIALAVGSLAVSGVMAMHWRQLKEAHRQGEMELKVNTMWEFQIRRGMVEARSMNILEKNSPIKVTDMAKPYLRQFKDELMAFMSEVPFGRMDDVDQFIALERQFGEVVIETICIPLKISQGACILSLMVYGRELLQHHPQAA
jgi:hypothetical protein